MKRLLLLLLIPCAVTAQPYTPSDTSIPAPGRGGGSAMGCDSISNNPFVNCGFENGDLSGWIAQDINDPLLPLDVTGPGFDIGFGFFITEPSQGTAAAISGFDGDGPGTIALSQDVSLPPGTQTIEFDYRAGWDLDTFGATLDREFLVQIEPSGGGAALATASILTAPAGNFTPDTGALHGAMDVTAFAGQNVRFSFVLDIPENFSGPALMQLDNVYITQEAIPVPAGSPLVWSVLIFLLMLASTAVRRRAFR